MPFRTKYQQPSSGIALRCVFAGIVMMLSPLTAQADHVLLQDGRGLFNVLVENTNTTWSRPLRIRHKPSSFGYDYRNKSAIALPGFAKYYYVADFVKTTGEVGKETARQIMEQRQWTRYRRPQRAILTPVAISSKRTTAPSQLVAIDPARLADSSLPIGERIVAQFEIFKNEQTALVNKTQFASAVKAVTPEQARQSRIDLLNSQMIILTQNYPSGNSEADKARDTLRSEANTVKQKSKFSWEN